MDYGIIVAGASLGGLHAFRTFLKGLPGDFPLPVAIVQHRGKDSGQPLSAYLQGCSTLEVVETEDKDEIVSGKVYVAPADYHLLIEDGWFSLSTGPQVRYSRPSIDLLFESAAYAYGKKAIGIILTGANQDGTDGLKIIKGRGGLTIAQNPSMAECGIMPGSAISSHAVDRVLQLESISGFLIEICGNKQHTASCRGENEYE